MTVLILGTGVIISYLFPKIVNCITIVGGVAGTNLVVIVPGINYILFSNLLGMIYLKVCGLPKHDPKKIFVYVVTIVLGSAGMIAAILSFLDITG